MYFVTSTLGYRKAIKRIARHKDFNPVKLNEVINTLAQGKKLDARKRDHNLSGDYTGLRECHVQNDILLVYQIIDKNLILLLVDIGSHSDLF